MKSNIIKDIEQVLGNGVKLQLPKNTIDPLRGLMGWQKNYPKYVLDEHGRLIGLNLAGTKLTNQKWGEILRIFKKYQVELKRLDLFSNQLTKFEITENLTELELLDIAKNPIENIAEEVFHQGKEFTLRFLKDLASQGESQLFEVKMLIVGEGGTGKTTFWNLIQDPNHPVPDETQKSTVGIQIREAWDFQHIDQSESTFLVNLWDFGGQDIQYMTHQFFLTPRSFYVLMADGRREVANFSYWLQIIELLGCVAEMEQTLPVLVVINEKGNPNYKMPYDPEEVQQHYKKLKLIKRDVDFAHKSDGRLQAVLNTMKEILCHQIDHLPLTIPLYWSNVRKRLYEIRTQNHINQEKFAAICQSEGIEDAQQQSDLSELLHDLGVILHYRNDTRLRDFIILNPKWAVNAVYEIMRDDRVKKNQGRFGHALLQEIWDEKGYSAMEQGRLLNLMLKDNLEVCFQATENQKEIFIAPQLLPESRPENLKWKPSLETLRYVYHYPFMPKGIIGRLIVRLNEDIEIQGEEKVVWVNGAVLQKENCRALIQYQHDKEKGRDIIKIEVQGGEVEGRKDLLRYIRQELSHIHRRSFPALRVKQLVPCNCPMCVNLLEPHEHDFDKLWENKEVNGNEAEMQCQISFKMVPVQQLLDGIFRTNDEFLFKKTAQGSPVIINNIINQEMSNTETTNSPPLNTNEKSDNTMKNDASNIYSYLAALVVAGGVAFVFIASLPILKGILGVASVAFFVILVGAFQLKNDQQLSEKSFMELIILILKKIPPLNWFGKRNAEKVNEEK